MATSDVFVSVGATATPKQENFVRAVEERLRQEGLVPYTVGRNTFSSDPPMKTVNTLLDRCSGTVVIALERSYFPRGFDKPGGPQQSRLNFVKLPTPWNQIEAAMSYARGLPLLVIVEAGLKNEGLLERGYDWYVQWVDLDVAVLNSDEFNGVLASWKAKVIKGPRPIPSSKRSLGLSLADQVSDLNFPQMLTILAALATIMGFLWKIIAIVVAGL